MNTEGSVVGEGVCRDSEGRRKRVASGALWFSATNPAVPLGVPLRCQRSGGPQRPRLR